MAKLCPKLTEPQRQQLQRASLQAGRVSDLRRIQAVIFFDEGQPLAWIERTTGLKRARLFSLRRAYLSRGLMALLHQGSPRSFLSNRQLRELKRTLRNAHLLRNLGYTDAFWTTQRLADYLRLAYGVSYKSKTSYYLIFKRVQFTYHKPGRVYVKRNEQEVKGWRKEAYPKLATAWADKDMEILAADEMIISTSTTLQKIWLPQGEYPQVLVSNTKKNLSLYGFLNLRTGREHAFMTAKQNMRTTRRILTRLRQIYPRQDNPGNKVKGKKLLILWDNPGWHRGSAVTDYIKKDGKIEIVYFPRYAPEENPQEHVWKEGRAKVTHNTFIPDLTKTAKDFVNYLNTTKFHYSLLGFTSNPI